MRLQDGKLLHNASGIPDASAASGVTDADETKGLVFVSRRQEIRHSRHHRVRRPRKDLLAASGHPLRKKTHQQHPPPSHHSGFVVLVS